KFFNLAERGIIEIEEDPAQVIGEYVAALGRALADQRMAEKMLSAPVALERTEHSFPRVLSAGQMKIIKKKLPHLSDDLNSWYRFIPKADNGYPTKADANFAALLKKTKGGFWDEMPGHQSGFFMRHEEIGPMRRLFEPGVSKSAVEGEKITESVIRNGLFLNGVTKRVQTLFNAFHYMTLTESGTAAVGWPFLKNLLKGAKDIPGAVGEFVVKGTAGAGRFPELKKLANIYGNLDTVVDSVDHGLVLGALPFAEREVLGEALNIGARWGKLVGLDKRKAPVAVAQALQKRILSWDAGLWDVFHNGSKTFAYQELLMKGTQRFPNMPLEKIKQATAQYVNNAFGGQQWSRFWMGKRGQELMRLMLFAPDWTISNARVAWDVMANFMMRGFNVPFELAKSMGVDEKVLRGVQLPGLDRISNFIARRMSQTGGGLFSAEAILQADIRAMYARQYALRAGLLAVGYGNILNYAFSGHSMNENSEGRKRMIELPYEDRHGKKAYLAIFKQFREPFEMLEDFQKFVRYKSGLALRGSIELWTGRDIFGRPIAGKKDGAVVKVGKHIGHLVPQGLPFAAQELFGFGGRGSKGASTFQRVAETAVSQFGLPIRREFIKGRRRATPRNRAGQASPTVALPRF
ncbi:MAG: hypothetical protein ACE5FA_06065, partial [Dehalococcoidia bacterium]